MSNVDTSTQSLAAGAAPPPTAGATGLGTAGVNFGLTGGSTSTAPSTSMGNTNALVSQDVGSFSQYTLSQLSGNSVTIGNVPGMPSGSTTIGAALQQFMQMSPAQLVQIEMQLLDAGFYTDGTGAPIPMQDVQFGVPGDPNSWVALARALGAASNSGQSFEQYLASRTQQQAPANAVMPSAVTGGGNTYTIDLSNPTDIKYTADQIFQATLGRNATSAEVDSITSSLRSQETAQGLTREQGAEQASQQRYQAGINQRNIAYENQVNPNLGGAIPAGPFNNPSDWATALLGYMGLPVTSSNVAAIASWENATGKFTDGSYNPLGTMRPEGGSTSGANGVQKFQTAAQGLEATASMLMNGRYQGLIAALQGGDATTAVQTNKQVQGEISSWSGGQVTNLTVNQQTQQQAQQSVTNGTPTPNEASQIGRIANNPNAPAPHGLGVLPATSNGSQGVPAIIGNPQQTVNPADVQQGQGPPNPGDAYINPTTIYDVNPASESARIYQAATTGANRIPFAADNYLNLFNAVVGMIQKGGPTG